MKIPTKASIVAVNALKKIKQYSPQIMMAVGTITSLAAVVEAIKQTPKASQIIEEHKDELKSYKEVYDKQIRPYSEKEYKTDAYTLCARTGLKLAKTYAMPVAMEVTSLACFFGAHKVMSDRNRTLSVALATMTDAYNSYRNKVVEAIGEEKEEQIRLGTVTDKIQKEITDENGKTKKVTERITSFDPANLGPYDIIWMEGDKGYDQSEEIRNFYVSRIASMWNQIIYENKLRDKVPLAEITEYFKDINDAYGNDLHIVSGYQQSDDDQAVIIKSRQVMVKQPDGYYLEGEVLSFNVQGSIVPTYIK